MSGPPPTSRRRDFGLTPIGRAWLDVIERRTRGSKERIQAGREYAEWDRVGSVDLTAGRLRATVLGKGSQPYHLEIEVAPFDDTQWATVLGVIADRSANVAALLEGTVDATVLSQCVEAQTPLVPTSADLTFSCSCPDRAQRCKHLIALGYLVAERLDADPFDLFLLRGRSRENVLAAIRQLQAGVTIEAIDDAPAATTDAGVDAAQVYASTDRPAPPPRRQPPAMIGETAGRPSTPPVGKAPTNDELDALARDAATRAFELLHHGEPTWLGLEATADVVRRAAMTFDLRSAALEQMADRAGIRAKDLIRQAEAWRMGGEHGYRLVMRETPYVATKAELADAEQKLIDEGGFRSDEVEVSDGAILLIGQRARLTPGPDGSWYRIERVRGAFHLVDASENDVLDVAG